MKKILSIILCFALLAGLFGCSRKTPAEEETEPAAVGESKLQQEESPEQTGSSEMQGFTAEERTSAAQESPAETGSAPASSPEALASPVIPQSPKREVLDSNGWKVVEEAESGSEYEDVYEMQEAQIAEYNEIRRSLPDFYSSTVGEILGNAEGKNAVYSPVNVYLALSMLAEIADGESRAQILSLLGADSIESLRESAKLLWHSNYIDDGYSTITLANSLWLQQDFPYRDETVQRLASEYYASVIRGMMGSSELNQMLQDWLNEHTGHLLKDSAQNIKTKPDTILALCSAIYFKAAWESEFNEDLTKKGEVFHGPSAEYRCEYLVSNEESAALFFGEHFTAYCRRMEDGNAMWFFLPDEGMSPEELSKDPEFQRFLQSDPYTEFREQSGNYMLHVEIPRFDVSSDLDLIAALRALGVTDVFSTEKADFSQILTENLEAAVSEVKHAARVKIDEEGCEAAAYTVIMLDKAMMIQQDRADFILDRPFLFSVRSYSGAILFTGIVNEPGEKITK